MAQISMKLEPMDRDIQLILSNDLTPQAQSSRIATVAREELVKAQDRNARALGFVPPHRTFVDNAASTQLERVSPNGVILFEFELLETMLGGIAEMLILASPVLTGQYQSSHALFADGDEVTPGEIPPNAKEYAFVNAQPYARKIERGLSQQAPEGVYHVVAEMAVRRYSNLARVRFGFRSLPAGAIGGWAGTRSARALAQRVRGGDPSKHTDWLTRQPAIIITPGSGR